MKVTKLLKSYISDIAIAGITITVTLVVFGIESYLVTSYFMKHTKKYLSKYLNVIHINIAQLNCAFYFKPLFHLIFKIIRALIWALIILNLYFFIPFCLIFVY